MVCPAMKNFSSSKPPYTKKPFRLVVIILFKNSILKKVAQKRHKTDNEEDKLSGSIPPYSMNVTTPAAARFIQHIKDSFSKTNHLSKIFKKKSRIRGIPTLSTDADSRTNTNLKRLHDFDRFCNKK